MWSRIPLVRLIIPFIFGLLFSEYLGGCDFPALVSGLSAGVFLVLGGMLYGLIFSHGGRWTYGLMIIFFMFSAGAYLIQDKQTDGMAKRESVRTDTATYIGFVEEGFVARQRSYRGLVRVMARHDSSGFSPLSVKVMVYASPDTMLLGLMEGGLIIFSASLREVQPPSNPGEFNYRQYLARHGIYHNVYLPDSSWKAIDTEGEKSLVAHAGNIRKGLISKLKSGLGYRQFSVSAALLLGDDAYLGQETRNAYARAGAMHILCVSGLHVGVVYLVLSTLLGSLRRGAFGRFLFPFILLASIWSYALITGLAPPVVRASSMLSFLIIGRETGRQSNVYNTLAASALVMLMFDPYTFFAAGFRLSYAAVLGIVALQRPVYMLMDFRNLLADKAWSITAVSLAAQMGTMPLVLYYFHQVPVYSLLTNLLVIPLSSLIIYAGLLFFAVPGPGFVSAAVSTVLNSLVSAMDIGVSFVEGLPYAAINGLFIGLPAMLLYYLLIIAISAFFLRRDRRFLWAGLILTAVISFQRLASSYQGLGQRTFIVYSLNGMSAMGIIEGRTHTLMADTALLNDTSVIDYSLKPYWLEMGLHSPDVKTVGSRDKGMKEGQMALIPLPGKRALLWEGRMPACPAPEKRIKLDYLVIRGKTPASLNEIAEWFNAGHVILDGSVPVWVKSLLTDSLDNELPIWDVREDGAFVTAY